MNREEATLTTRDGRCPVSLFWPTADRPLPPLIFAMDGFGRRESLDAMAARIAGLGYVVALPDLYYRVGSILSLLPAGTPRDVRTLVPMLMSVPEIRSRFREQFFGSATRPQHIVTDLGGLLDHLATRPEVRPGPAGIVGYCMGGNVALRAACLLGERIAAAASFHGGYLATEAPDSPHLGAAQIRARLAVIAAQDDPTFGDDSQARLQAALTAAGVRHQIETYPARHGFCVPDMPTHDAAAAERHYAVIAELMAASL